MSQGANPLLIDNGLPNHAPAFDKITPEHYMPAVEAAIAQARQNIEAIKSDSRAPDFDNTMVALETASELLDQVTTIFYNQLSCIGGDDLHALAEKIGPMSADFSSEVIMDPALFARIKAVHDKKETLNLSVEQNTLLEDTYIEFVRGGALLGDKDQARMKEISQELSVLSPTFMNNAKKSAEQFELWIDTPGDVAGLPESALAQAAQEAANKNAAGRWLFTLDAPSYIPFMQYTDNRALREKMWRAYGSRAWGDAYDNSANVLQIVGLKYERAKILGYASHAHYVLERRMAERPETVLEFLQTLKTAYLPAAQAELQQIRDFARERDGLDDIKPWDVSYYSEKLRQKLFNFSGEDLRPYFPLEKVLNGTFEHFSRLFSLNFKESAAYPVWHEDVKAYEVWDQTNNEFVGVLYTDFYPRAGKKDGAWKTSYRAQGLFKGKIERPLVAICCNFTPPAAGRPSLLTHREVLTLFHELGHAVHSLLSKVTYRSQAGTSVLWDFVELPSQVQENWCYEKETLDILSGHYETGERIPGELIDKVRNAQNFMVGIGGLRQVSFASLDLAWHTCDPETVTDVAAFEDAQTKGTALFPRYAGPFSNSFGHIFAGGYSAGYYSYKWAEVLDADTFELFKERGLYDRATADSYKNEILSRGGTEHPRILYSRFRGRDADPQALLRREGLLSAA